MMLPRRGAFVVICLAAIAVCASSCSASPSTSDTEGPAFEANFAQAGTEAFDPGLYCIALHNMIAAQPQGAIRPGAFDDYASSIEAAVPHAPARDKDVLSELAALTRDQDSATAEDFFELAGRTARIFEFANEECGATTSEAAASPADRGDASTRISAQVSGPPMTVTSDDVTVHAPLLPTSEPLEPDRLIDANADSRTVAAKVNGAIPKTRSLRFEWQQVATDDDGDYTATVLVPANWNTTIGPFNTRYDHPDFDFSTEMELSTGCQGVCEPQDWSQVMEDPEMSPFLISGDPNDYAILVDQELTNPDGRLVVYAELDSAFADTRLIVARWSPEADKFFRCEAALGGDDQSLWPSFADACLASKADWMR